jgi:SAM-dependent methyltransferase
MYRMNWTGETAAAEMSRVRVEYARRAGQQSTRYGLFDAAALQHSQSVERQLLAALKRHGLAQLTEARILDVGCGSGGLLRRFVEYGATPENLFGLDLLEDRIEQARRRNPALNWQAGSAHELPYPDGSFDVVTLYVVLSSILDPEMRRRVAGEAVRVTKPGGVVICHDFCYDNPRNAQVVGIPPRELRTLFGLGGRRCEFRRVVLAPPLARRIAPRLPWLSQSLEALRLLNTHTLAVSYRP